MTQFDEVYKKFLDWSLYGRDTPVSPQTHHTYRWAMNVLSPYFCRVKDISRENIEVLKRDMYNKKFTTRYVYKNLCVIRTFLRYCRDELGMRVMSHRDVKLPKRERREVEYLTKDEVYTLFYHLAQRRGNSLRMQALLAIMLDSAMRISEVLSMNKEDIDWEGRRAYVTGKGRKKRMVMFSTWSLDILRYYLSSRCDNEDAVFVSRDRGEVKRLDQRNARKQLERLNMIIKNPKLKFHSIRRTAATHFWMAGADVRDVQIFLGHSDLKITQLYLGDDYEKVQRDHAKYMSWGLTLGKGNDIYSVYAEKKSRKTTKRSAQPVGRRVARSKKTLF